MGKELLNSENKEAVAKNITKIADYLYEVTCDNYEDNYPKANEHFEKVMSKFGGCSSVQVGVLRGRNYDLSYDDTAEFVIHVPAKEGRHASVGVAQCFDIMTEDVDTGKYLELYDILPYYTLDGINDSGLVININIVNFGEKGVFDMNKWDTSDDVCPMAVCRLLLDSCGSIDECLEKLSKMFISPFGNISESHFMITGKQSPDDDTVNTVVVEFIPDDNKRFILSVIDYNKGDFVGNRPIMTNFHLTGFDGTEESLTKHPMGYERWQILYNAFNQGLTLRGMKDLMRKVFYSNKYDIYSNNYWYSELCIGDLTMDDRGEAKLNGDCSRGGAYADIIKEEATTYTYAKRAESSLWHTVHTSIYDIEDYHLYVLPQESGYAFSFDFEGQVDIAK